VESHCYRLDVSQQVWLASENDTQPTRCEDKSDVDATE